MIMKEQGVEAREQAVQKTDELMGILNRIKGTHDELAVIQTLVARVFEQGHERTLRDAISSHFLAQANALYHQKHPWNQNEAITLFKLSSRVKAAW
jgi:hypothetical protein